MRGMNSETVDLVYLDPPFKKDKKFQGALKGRVKQEIVNYMDSIAKQEPELYDKWINYVEENINDKDEIEIKFDDAWKLTKVKEYQLEELRSQHPSMYKIIYAIPDDDTKAYMIFMGVRLIEMHRVLRSTGSLYLHCDQDANSYLRILLDLVFGRKNFRNEVVWAYRTGGNSNTAFAQKHDTIYIYSKTAKNYTFNLMKEKTYTKSKNRKPGVVNYGAGTAEFFEDDKSVYNYTNMRDVWELSYINSQSIERLGYPTQKPLALLDRIIKASSNETDLVFDPFAGCATALESAYLNNRNWIGCDISFMATVLLRYRIHRNKDLHAHCQFQYALSDKQLPYRTIKEDVQSPTDKVRLAPKEYIRIKRKLFGEQEGKCGREDLPWGCGKDYDFKIFEMDHITPRSKGGTDDESNFQLLCGPCNRSKSNRQ